jgi:ATP-binding cassette subfamily B protein
MGKTNSSASAADTLRLFYKATVPYKREQYGALLHPIGAVLLGVGVPFFAGKILAGLTDPHSNLQGPLIWLALAAAGGVLSNRIGFTQLMVLQARVMADLHQRVFSHLLSRSVGFHADRISGKLISDVIDFVNAYSTLVVAIYINGFSFLATLLIGLVVVFINSWQLGLFLTFVVGATLLWAWIDSRVRSQLRAARLVAIKNLTAHLSDTIINAQTVKTFAHEQLERENNQKLNEILGDLRVRDWQRAGKSGSNRTGAILAMQFCMFLLIIKLTRDNPAMLATGIFAFTYTLTLTSRLFEINNLTRQIEESFLNASPVTRMLREQIEIEDHPDAKPATIRKGKIDITNVSFTYQNNAASGEVFEGLNLHIKPGEKVGLVGPSGGGKSTLTRLLLRFDEVQSGTISFDGHDITKITQASLRQSVAYVPQEPLLFHRSIRENIAYGKPDATDEEVIAAAKKANAHHFITTLSDSYDTVVGERGVKLSGGQRQRVAIARAILKNAPVLVLDEATSALDSENEVEVQHALWKLMQGRTAIVVAHRLSTIQKMDRIIVLEDGRIIEEGTHKELLKHKGIYAKLWGHQSGGFIED